MKKTVFGFIVFFWLALHSSQSIMDLADAILLGLAFWIAYKSHEIPKLFKSYQPWILWPCWIGIVILGFVFGAPVELKTAAKLTWEFRWCLSLLGFIYLFQKVDWTENRLRTFSFTLLAIGLLDVALFFIDYEKDPRAGGLFGHSMPFAHTMGPSVLFLLFIGVKKVFARNQSLFWKVVYGVAPILGAALVVLSFTRGVWLGFTVAVLTASVFLGRKIFVGSLLALVLTAGGLFVGSGRVQNRVLGKTVAEPQSNNERLLYWKANLQIFRDFPVVGIGYSQNNVHVEEYLRKDGVAWLQGGHAHNQFIHFLAGTGILGLACFLVFLFFLLWPVTRYLWARRNDVNLLDTYYLALGCYAGMICFLVGSLTESNFSIAKNRFMFLFIAAIAYAIAQRDSLRTNKK